MNVLWLLALILLSLMYWVGGKQGVKSFFTIFFNFSIIIVAIIFMADPARNPVILALLACVTIGYVNLFFLNGNNVKTKAAFLSSMLTIAVLMIGIYFITELTHIQGFGEEEGEEIAALSVMIGIDFVQLMASVIILSTIGAIIDNAISIASPMNEIHRYHPNLKRKELFRRGMAIGKDILGTSANTIFFAFFGSFLALLVWFKDLSYSFGDVVNARVLSAELITVLFAGAGVAIIIPVTAWVTAFVLEKGWFRGKEGEG
ncbi:YibE/F family protein [Halalkalibacillus halophilus]|uniref:YibE/F family protein n=1 Tax=Halalkalibacillus halophilus TaxID=392827 RepID=UPI0004296D57|nr:YibE/F family protein [Halalkalibacillus halophilus]